METIGLHHVTVATHDIQRFYNFYNKLLGLKLIMEDMNIENEAMKHLYFGDNNGNAGTLLSVLEVANPFTIEDCSDEIYAYSFRVPTDYSLYVFKLRFDAANVKYEAVIKINGKHALPFYDCDGRKVFLISDELNTGIPLGEPTPDSAVDPLHQILGLGPVFLKLSNVLVTSSFLTQVLNLSTTTKYVLPSFINEVHVLQTGLGGNGGEIHIIPYERTENSNALNIEQVAFTVSREALASFKKKLEEVSIPHSKISDRKYYETIFIKDLSGIIFEISTETHFN